MEKISGIQILSDYGRPIDLDVFYKKTNKPKPIIIFVHGFKGFKDWGTFDLIGEYFATRQFVFLKFNFSFNGIDPEEKLEITDFEAFAENNYSKELDDLGNVIDWVRQEGNLPDEEIDKNKVYLIGHSRGGSVTILKTFEDQRVTGGISWSAPKDLNRWSSETIKEWEENGVTYVQNGRTGELLPMHYQLMEELERNRERLDLKKAVQNLNKPFMMAHGTEDEAVAYEDALTMKNWNTDLKLALIPNAGHTYGGSHPYNSNQLPTDLQHLLNACYEFLKQS